jgi:dihydroxy-acid dehydratase
VPRYTSGVFAKYAALVSSAAEGAVTQVPASSSPTHAEAKEVNDGHHLHG